MGTCAIFKALNKTDFEKCLGSTKYLENIIFPEDDFDDAAEWDVDKSWDCLHYVLSGSHESDGSLLSDSILGGVPVDIDLDSGPVRFIEHSKVSEIANSLENVDFESAFSNVNRKSPAIEAVYLSQFLESDGFDYLNAHFSTLKTAYQSAKQNGDAMMIYFG